MLCLLCDTKSRSNKVLINKEMYLKPKVVLLVVFEGWRLYEYRTRVLQYHAYT